MSTKTPLMKQLDVEIDNSNARINSKKSTRKLKDKSATISNEEESESEE